MKDRFGREIDYLRLSVTDNCNLRCIYCMEDIEPEFLSFEDKITDEEILKILNVSAELGIKKVRITGGEPLVRKGIVDLIEKINNIKGIEEIYLTTNGILLYDIVERLSQSGVKGVNISLDSLKPDRFKELTRVGDLYKVLKAIDKCIEFGLIVKINTVMVNDINRDEIIDFVKLTINKPIDLRFIELMPIGVGKFYKGVSNDEIMVIIKELYSNITEIEKVKGSGPASYLKLPNAKGKIGFISAVSNCFCKECNRIRVTSEGYLKQCLHFNYGVNLKSLINEGISEFELKEIIKNNIFNKPEKHKFNMVDKNQEIKFMNQIGG